MHIESGHANSEITEPWGLPGSVALTILLALTVSTCSVVGPKSITNGRLTCNQAIAQTESQQILMAILNNRYEEKISLLMLVMQKLGMGIVLHRRECCRRMVQT